MRAARWIGIFAALLSQPVFAEETCVRDALRGLAEGPVSAGYFDADVGVGRRACPRTEVGVGVKGGAIIDTPNFYGDVAGAGVVFASYALEPRTELFATLEAARYEFIQNATLQTTAIHLGQLTAGATHVLVAANGWVLSPSARLLLPTSTAFQNERVVGLELGAAVRKAFSSRFDFYGYFGVDSSLAFGDAPADPRGGVLGNAGVEYTFFRGFGLALDANAHLGHRAPLDYVAPALAFRFAVGAHVGVEIGASVPLAGADRHDAVGGVRVSYRL